MRLTFLTTAGKYLACSGRVTAAPATVLLRVVLVLALFSGAAMSQESERPAGWSEASHSKRAVPDYDRIFSMDRVHELRLSIDPSDFEAMEQDLRTIGPARRPAGNGAGPTVRVAPDLTSRDPIYVPVTVRYGDRQWPGVGMRYKGNSSLMMAQTSGSGKVPFRLDFDRYEDEVPGTKNQRFFGFHKLTFSSNFSDATMLKEVLATEILRDRGVPAARAAFYRVFVDTGNGDEYWGLYTMIEDPADGAMLDSQFGGRGGNLYKPNGPGASWTQFHEQGFVKKTNEKANDFSDVEAAFAALHASADEPESWRRNLEAVFDADGFLRWLAVNTVIQNWDSYGRMPHNYYLYADPAEGGRLSWIPWDHNMAFAMTGRLGGGFRLLRVNRPAVAGAGSLAPLQIDESRRENLERLETLILERGRILESGEIPERRQVVDAPVDRDRSQSLDRISRVVAMPLAAVGDDILYLHIDDGWPLISRLLADDVYAARYRELLEYALDGLAAPAAFEARARELHAMISTYVVGPEGELATHTTLGSPDLFLQSLDGPGGLIEQFGNRREQVRAALANE